jgi:hypothetical protein
VVVGSITAWLLLPPAGFKLPGFPDYDKSTAAVTGILLGTLIFEPGRLIVPRPLKINYPGKIAVAKGGWGE